MCNKAAKGCKPPPCCSRCPPPCCAKCPPPCSYKPVSYCLFDLESAVFDTRNVYETACRDILATYDRTLPDIVLLQCNTMETTEMAELVTRKCNLPVPWERFLVQLNDHVFALISQPPFMAGVERLVKHLSKNCISMALITRCTQEMYKRKIQGREQFFELFGHVVCSDDAELNQRKPEPDVYLLAMSRFCGDPSADCCLAFDGTQKGVQAARDARMQVIMLPEPNLPCYWSERATMRLNTLEEFKPEDFCLPAYSCGQPKEASKPKSTRKKGGMDKPQQSLFTCNWQYKYINDIRASTL